MHFPAVISSLPPLLFLRRHRCPLLLPLLLLLLLPLPLLLPQPLLLRSAFR